LRLDVDLARRAIETHLAQPLKLSVEEAAFGVREVANANMARAIRAVSVERGIDPRDYALAAFGGSGPMHACDLARSLEIRHIMLPMMPGVFTALGMLTGDVERHFLTAMPGLLEHLIMAELGEAANHLRQQAVAALAEENVSDHQMQLAFTLELRFEGQDSEIPVALPDDLEQAGIDSLRAAFLDAYRAIYQYAADDAVEVVNLRLLARGIRPGKLDFSDLRTMNDTHIGETGGRRPVYFSRDIGWLDTPIINRSEFQGTAEGPMILESADCTIAIPPRARIEADKIGNLMITLAEERA
jgi:N-methylhydantoinase A